MKRIIKADEVKITVNGETVIINTKYCEMEWVGHDNGGQYGSWEALLTDMAEIFNRHKLN